MEIARADQIFDHTNEPRAHLNGLDIPENFALPPLAAVRADVVFPLFGSEPMPNLNRTRTGPHVRFGVRQILDFAEPVRTCSNR
jgi:hypothetical protein